MDTSKAKNKKGTKAKDTEREVLKIDSFEVSEVRIIETSKGDMVMFSLTVNGVKIYSCRVVTGKNGDFISMPQNKGKNGQYYNVVYLPLSDEDSKKILDKVQEEINKL